MPEFIDIRLIKSWIRHQYKQKKNEMDILVFSVQLRGGPLESYKKTSLSGKVVQWTKRWHLRATGAPHWPYDSFVSKFHWISSYQASGSSFSFVWKLLFGSSWSLQVFLPSPFLRRSFSKLTLSHHDFSHMAVTETTVITCNTKKCPLRWANKLFLS